MKKALLQMHLAVLLWGFTGILGKAISLDAPVLVWYRMLLTAIFMACILFYRKQWVKIAPRDFLVLILVGCLMGLHWVGFYGAIKFANVSIALVCLSTASVFTSLLDPLINKGKYDLKEFLLGAIALLGVYLIYQFQQLFWVGILFGITAAILSSVFTVLNKRVAHKYPARTMVFYEMTTGWLLITILMPVQYHFFPNTNFLPHTDSLFGSNWYHNDWLWLIILSLCCTVWAQSLALTALKKLTSFTVTLTVNLEPVYGILLAFLFYKENKQLHAGFFIGMGLILLSVVLQMIRLLSPIITASPGYIREKGGLD
ncbi:MAG TPA: EamA family transporter [Flavipsychrobacter sp.]|nr:EamA family transporter [Flavipsychrobacter sp.]